MPRKKVSSAENTVRNIRRQTRKKYSGEEKFRIVLEGLRGEESVAELWRRMVRYGYSTQEGSYLPWKTMALGLTIHH